MIWKVMWFEIMGLQGALFRAVGMSGSALRRAF
jgi:hypothetical protein